MLCCVISLRPDVIQGDGTRYNFLMNHTAYVEKQAQGQPIIPDVD
jgi:hypothetical protein